ncbi:MAG: methyl-accepting chemotaxis protein [Firmicutes bacterium]|nr:methyl-accepting chemotaxis protein [Bacillota bacterium]
MRWYYNMKVGTKLTAGFLFIALFALAVGLIGIINIQVVDDLDTELYETMTVPLGEMIYIAESFQALRTEIYIAMRATSAEEFTATETRISAREEEFKAGLATYVTTLFSDEGKLLSEELAKNFALFEEMVENVVQLAKENRHDEANIVIRDVGIPLRTAIETAYHRLAEIKVDSAKDAAAFNTATTQASIKQSITIIVIGLLLSIIIALFISSSIKKPINILAVAAEKIADGDLDVTININSKDEIGVLANSFSRMSENINDVMSNINAASEQVAAGSKQVSDSSIVLSQGATEQASSIEELTASLEEISEQTKLNANNADEANILAESAKVNAEQGNHQMEDMLKAMEEINDSSSNISKIIKVIDEIAFQTNILALNAAVEAARAGQHGKGFAVVAEEVRNLAARSANAAKETTDMIEGSIKKVEGGTKIANLTADALNRIVEGIGKVANLVSNIAVASNEQASAIEQVNLGVMQVSDVVQSNSATSEESAAASEELAGQAELMKEQVAQFKLKDVNRTVSLYREKEDHKKLELSEGNKGRERKLLMGQQEAAATRTKEISLSDKEYGKY